MTYQPTPRKIELQHRFDTIASALRPHGVSLIVGEGFRGYEGRCVRLSYARDQYGSPSGYYLSVVDIDRSGKEIQYRQSERQFVRSDEVGVAEQRNIGGGIGAICMLPNPERITEAAQRLLYRPHFPNGWLPL